MDYVKPFEKPVGFRDLLPEVAEKKRLIEAKLQQLFSRWGYQEMHTPTLEYDETVGKASRIPSSKMFKLLDRMGHTLVLRPDMTAPIARVVSSILKTDQWPIRLSYHTNVFRAQENEVGRAAEFFQSGVELVGEGSPDADAEILALARESLAVLGISSFQITVNHIGYLDGVLDEWVEDQVIKGELKGYLSNKNYVGYREKVKEVVTSKKERDALLSLTSFHGDIQVLYDAYEQTNSVKARRALDDMLEIWKLLRVYQVEANIRFDLAMVPHLEYYTGMIFEASTDETAYPVCSGGRYDALLDSFGNPQRAIGFALKVNRILEISKEKQEAPNRVKILYDLEHQEEALSYAMRLREETDKIVETYRVNESRQFQAEDKDEIVHFTK